MMAIRIEDLNESDKGQKVVYRPRHGGKNEDGFIKSWNDHVIFVDYQDGSPNAKATRPEDLVFLSRNIHHEHT